MRDRWSSKLIFILAAVGSAVGLGNVWRFPYLVGKYGGGAFLLPYFLILIVLGYPLLVMEFALGQKMQKGAVHAFKKISPRLKGVGYVAVFSAFAVTCYYTVIMAWSLLYTVFSTDLRWGQDTKAFFFKDVLQITASVNDIGHVSVPILFAFVLSWVLIYFSVWKGVKSVGKVVAITMPLPIIILFILCIRGVTLPGAMDGLSFYLKPSFAALKDVDVWIAAMSQIFFTLTLGFGVMISYASFRDEKSDISKTALTTAILNSGISIVAGFAVFSTLGYMAFNSGVPVAELAKSGPSLAFIVFPQALSLIPGARFFAILFFVMLVTLAIDSAFSLVEAVATVVSDKYKSMRKQDLVLYVCVVGFVGGLIFTTFAGLYYLDIVDHFVTQYGLVTVGLLQCLAVGWGYGADKLRAYINEVSAFKLGAWWDIAIKYVIPVILFGLIVMSLIQDIKNPYGGYPDWALSIFGWGLLFVILSAAFFISFAGNHKDSVSD